MSIEGHLALLRAQTDWVLDLLDRIGHGTEKSFLEILHLNCAKTWLAGHTASHRATCAARCRAFCEMTGSIALFDRRLQTTKRPAPLSSGYHGDLDHLADFRVGTARILALLGGRDEHGIGSSFVEMLYCEFSKPRLAAAVATREPDCEARCRCFCELTGWIGEFDRRQKPRNRSVVLFAHLLHGLPRGTPRNEIPEEVVEESIQRTAETRGLSPETVRNHAFKCRELEPDLKIPVGPQWRVAKP